MHLDDTLTDITAEAPLPEPAGRWPRRISLRAALGVILLTIALGVGLGEALRPESSTVRTTSPEAAPDGQDEPAPPPSTVQEAATPPAGTATTTTSTPSTTSTTGPVPTTADRNADVADQHAAGMEPAVDQPAEVADPQPAPTVPETEPEPTPETPPTTFPCDRDGQPWDGCPEDPDDPSWCTDQGGILTYGPTGEPWDWMCQL